MMFRRVSRCTLSKAFSKSMKYVYRLEFHSMAYSRMFLNMNNCSVVPLPALKPACSSQRCLSTSFANLCTMIFLIIFAVVGMSVIPLQFPHFVKSPFLCSFKISPLFQSVGAFSSVHTLLNCSWICLADVSWFVQRNSTVILSTSGAFPFSSLSALLLFPHTMVVFHLRLDLVRFESPHLLFLVGQVYWGLCKSVLSTLLPLRFPWLTGAIACPWHCPPVEVVHYTSSL